MTAELRAYNPSWKDLLAQFVLGDEKPSETKRRAVLATLGTTGLGNDGISLVDATPLGMVFSGNDAYRSAQNGHYGEAALNALGAVPAGMVTGATLKAIKGAKQVENVASRVVPVYNPPVKPQRPFELDYPNGARTDAAGKLTHDIDGRPLTAEYIAGRNVVGGTDAPISPQGIIAIGEGGTGRGITPVAPSSIRGDVGSVNINRYTKQPDEIFISNKLTPSQTEKVLGHEVGHVIDQTVGEIPTKGLSRELDPMYDALNTGRERTKNFTKPQHLGYSGDDIPREHMADAIRAYMADPNYIKSVSPKTAARIREYVNSNPKLKDLIQFNSVAAIGGTGALAMGGTDKAEASEMANWWEAAPLVEQPQSGDTNNWWEAAPLVDEQPADPYQGNFVNDGTQGPTIAHGGAALPQEKTLGGAGMTWLENAINGIPIVGPSIQKGSDFVGSNLYGLATGQDPTQIREEVNQRREGRNEAYPLSAISGTVAANIAPMSAIGRTAAGAQSLGVTGANWLTRAGNSAASSAMISGADTVARGGNMEETVGGMARSAGIGAAIPILGAGISKGLETFGNRNISTIGAMLNPAKEAERRVGSAFLRDAQADPKSIMSAADQQIAHANNIPLVNADIGGETTRALSRSVANQSPEARAVIEKTANERFASQGQRATEYIKKITGGNADDISYRQMLQEQAKHTNKAAYDAAYQSPHAQQVYTKGLQELMQAPSLRKAVADVPMRSADRGAVQGFKEIGNPFTQNSQGVYVLRQKADGTLIAPNLQFWDHVKRNLDGQIGAAKRGGDNSLFADLNAIKNKLTSELDGAVPAYKQARQGAAGFFDADDALDAGRKFVNSPRSVPEVKQAFNAFNGTEKKAFATGYASELIDKIKASGDRVNVINQVFKSQASRESMEMAFGAQKMKQIEAYVRVEDLADRLRGAMGNSTTARQLAELGIGAGAGAYATGDWKGAVGGALAVKGGRYIAHAANDKTMQGVAKLLMSNQHQALIVAAQQAALKPAYMRAIERLSNMLALPARSGAVMAGQ